MVPSPKQTTVSLCVSLLLSFWGVNHAPPPRQPEEPARGEYLIWI